MNLVNVATTILLLSVTSFSLARTKNDSNGNNKTGEATQLTIYSANLDFYYKDTRTYYAEYPDFFRYSPGKFYVDNQVDGAGRILPQFSPIWVAIHENGHSCNDQISALDPNSLPRQKVIVQGSFRNCNTLPPGQTTGKTVPCTWIVEPTCTTVEEEY